MLRHCASCFSNEVTSTLPVFDDRVAVVPAAFESIDNVTSEVQEKLPESQHTQ